MNRRYLEALAAVDNPTAAYQQVEHLVQPQLVSNRRHAGFNPARSSDVRLFQAVMQGDHLLRGFRNADTRLRLYGVAANIAEHRRHAAAVSRLLKRLHVRGLIAKIPRSYRWRVTLTGHSLLGTIIALYHKGLSHAA